MLHGLLQACACHRQRTRKAYGGLPIFSCYRRLFGRSGHAARPVVRSGQDIFRVGYVDCIRRCGQDSLLCKGMAIHFIMIENGDDKDVLVVNLVVEMYGKCKAIHDAHATFDKLEGRNVFSWTIMIGAYAHSGLGKEALELFRSMEPAGVPPNNVTFVTIISVCASFGDLSEGKLVHSCVEASPFIYDEKVGNALIHMYDKCGSIEDACLIFEKLSERNVVTWNAFIAAYAKRGCDKALQLFSQMQLESVIPDHVTFLNTLDLFASRNELCDCKRMHARIVGLGSNPGILLGTTVLCAYAKCGGIEHSFLLFNDLPHDCTIVWNAILGAYEVQGEEAKILQLYQQMLQENVIPDKVSCIMIFSSCVSSQEGLCKGRQLHACSLFSPFDWDLIFWNALINMYGKGGDLREAFITLDEAPTCDDSSWNALIAAHAQHNQEEKAIQFFKHMQMQCVIPNKVTFISLLDACGKKIKIGEGKHAHACMSLSLCEEDVIESRPSKASFFSDLDFLGDQQCKEAKIYSKAGSLLNCALGNALVTMYSKCGRLDDAWTVFDRMPNRDVISWTAIIAAYAQEGQGGIAFRLFFRMQDEGVDPNNVTFISILDAFADRASLSEGQVFHFYLVTIDYEMDMEVGNTAMAVYSNCGCLEDAQRLFDRMSKRNAISWTILISIYSHYGMGKKAHSLYLEMQKAGIVPTPVTFVSVLSACSHSGLFEEGCRCFDSITESYGLTPTLEHYNCMVDLFARAGKLEEGIRMIHKMPSSPTSTTWMTLLGACKMHQNVERSLSVAEKIFELEPKRATPYVLLYNIFSAAGRCEDAEQIKNVMISKGLNKQSIVSHSDNLSMDEKNSFVFTDIDGIQAASASI